MNKKKEEEDSSARGGTLKSLKKTERKLSRVNQEPLKRLFIFELSPFIGAVEEAKLDQALAVLLKSKNDQ